MNSKKINTVYNLSNRDDGKASEYYQEVKAFSTKLYLELEKKFSTILDEYEDFVVDKLHEKPRSRAEYAVEILTIGNAIDRYRVAAKRSNSFTLFCLKTLYTLRKISYLKKSVDIVRGVLVSLFLVPNIGKVSTFRFFTLKDFEKLISYLQATGEFKDEVKRFSNWRLFFIKSIPNQQITDTFAHIQSFFSTFSEQAKDCLGKYTEGVAPFLLGDFQKYQFREDVIFCGKSESEYHLNMFGAEIMNRGFIKGFTKAKKRTLLVPGCMKSDNGLNCKEIIDDVIIRCAECSENCTISHLTKLGKKHDFDVTIIPHSSSFTKYLTRFGNSADVAVVAVACLLNLVPGGYEMRELGINAQCLLLNYPGCKKHWDKNGVSTMVDEGELLRIMGK